MGLAAAIALLILHAAPGHGFIGAVQGWGLSGLLYNAFGGDVRAVMSVLLAVQAVFAILGIAAVIYGRRHPRSGGILLIIAGMGIALSSGVVFWVTTPLLVLGGILLLLGGPSPSTPEVNST